SRFDLHVVTARHIDTKGDTIAWLEEHFPGHFKDIHFTFHNGSRRPKSEICRLADLPTLIEDNGDYARECADSGINVLLMDHPWNRTVPEGWKIRRVQSWDHAVDAAFALHPRRRLGRRTKPFGKRYLLRPALV